jgi:membrane fusion protein
LLTGLFAISIVGAGVFLSLGTYGRKETVLGYLTPVTGVAKVLPPSSGVVAELYVVEGDLVVAGQRLLSVRSERHDAQGQAVDSAIIDRLQAKRDAISLRIKIERRIGEEQPTRSRRNWNAGRPLTTTLNLYDPSSRWATSP